MSTSRISVVGAGDWGKNLVRNFHALNALHSICDDDYEKSSALSKQYSVPALSWHQILTNPEIDAVVIATQADTHFKLAKEALNVGKNVFVEKPLALCIKDVVKLDALAKDKNRKLMCGHLLQYHEAFITLKRLVSQGELGDIQYIYSNRLNLGKIYSGQDALWDLAPHDLSMILSLVNSDTKKICYYGNKILNSSISDFSMLHIEFMNKVKAHIFVSWLNPEKEQKLVVVGDKKIAIFNDLKPWEEKLAILPCLQDNINEFKKISLSKENLTYVPLSPSEPLRNECAHFIDCIANDKNPRTDGNESISILKILEQASCSNLLSV